MSTFSLVIIAIGIIFLIRLEITFKAHMKALDITFNDGSLESVLRVANSSLGVDTFDLSKWTFAQFFPWLKEFK